MKVTPLAATRNIRYQPEGVSSAVMRAIEPEPNHRFNSVAEFRQALHQGVPNLAQSPGQGVSPQRVNQPQKPATAQGLTVIPSSGNQSPISPLQQINPYQGQQYQPTAKQPFLRRIPKTVWLALSATLIISLCGITIGLGVSIADELIEKLPFIGNHTLLGESYRNCLICYCEPTCTSYTQLGAIHTTFLTGFVNTFHTD